MGATVKAVQSAPACADHRDACGRCGTPCEDSGNGAALEHARHCDACAQAVADAVLVAAREGGWERAVPDGVLHRGTMHYLEAVLAAELRRRAKEETTK